MKHYYLEETSEPIFGAICLGDGRYVFPREIHTMPDAVKDACNEWLLQKKGSYTIVADTDAGCDRICEYVDYQPVEYKNVILRDGKLAGFFFHLGFFYSISPERPNVHAFFLEDLTPLRHESRSIYQMIRREPGKTYENTEHIY